MYYQVGSCNQKPILLPLSELSNKQNSDTINVSEDWNTMPSMYSQENFGAIMDIGEKSYVVRGYNDNHERFSIKWKIMYNPTGRWGKLMCLHFIIIGSDT